MGLQQKDGGNSEIHSALRFSRGNEKEYNVPDTSLQRQLQRVRAMDRKDSL